MKLKLLGGIAVAAVCAASGAFAEDGWYGALDVGAHFPQKDTATTPGGPNYSIYSKTNVVGFARIGYRVSPYIRLEIEGGYRPGELKYVVPQNPAGSSICNVNSYTSCNSPGGVDHAWTAMANALVDILPSSKLDPFIGGGIGLVHAHINTAGYTSVPPRDSIALAGSPDQFGYQGIAGLSYAWNDHINVDLTYRYLASERGTYTAYPGGSAPIYYNAKYEDQSVTLGLRYSFASPPPPPPPPPPPAPPPTDWTIYFPFDPFVITPEAQTVLQDAASHAVNDHATKEIVVGHTDTSGSVAYNLRLSERRAKATADGLVALGVPAASLDVSWKGKSDLAVQTPDGVKEPLNRRATIHNVY